MLFYMKYSSQADIDKIPSTYTIINITSKKKMPNHSNIKNLNITPDTEVGKDDPKERYIYKLNTKYREYLVVLTNMLLNTPAAQSIVIVCSNKECEKYGFNVAKVICKYIENRYSYNAFKFTNTVTKSMRLESVFSDKGLTRLIKDMNSLNKLLKI